MTVIKYSGWQYLAGQNDPALHLTQKTYQEYQSDFGCQEQAVGEKVEGVSRPATQRYFTIL